MSRGRRYDNEPKLNMKKVFAVIIAFAVIIMFIFIIIDLLDGDSILSNKNFATAYYTAYENNKWGIIDTKGNIVIEPQYDEMVIIPDNSKKVFICVYDANYNTGEYNSKAVNEKNEALYTEYTKVEAITNYDKNNNVWHEQNTLKVQKDGKYGLIDINGRNILACEYDDISPLIGIKNILITTKDGKKGAVDCLGKVIAENEYKTIASLTSKYEDGLIVENAEGKFGVVSYNKEIVLEPKYDKIANVYGNNTYVVTEAGTSKLIDKDGNSYLAGKFDEVKEINLDNVIVKNANKYGILSKTGEEKVPAQYEDLTFAFSEYYIARENGKYGIINIANEEKVPFKYMYLSYSSEAGFMQAETESYETEILDRDLEVKVKGILSEVNIDKGYIKVRKDDKYEYYNLSLQQRENTDILTGNTLFLKKENGKYGYTNEKGIVVVDYIYDDATEQNNYGYVAVKKDGKWGCLDQTGKVIVEPTYEFANNLVIDFIGSWHLAEDINANYYTK